MKFIKNNSFKLINIFMVVFCIYTMCMNFVGVNVLNGDLATSSINGNNFEYETSENSFMLKKDGKLIGCLPTDKKLFIRNDNLFFQSNAGVVVVRAIGALMSGGDVGKEVAHALEEILGGAAALGTAMLSLPGGAAAEATLGGAGAEAAAAAAADAAVAAGGMGALMSTFVGPVLAAAGVGAALM